MNIEITVTQAFDEDLFEHLAQARLTDSDAFALDIMDKEYIALPRQVLKTGDSIRAKILLVEVDD